MQGAAYIPWEKQRGILAQNEAQGQQNPQALPTTEAPATRLRQNLPVGGSPRKLAPRKLCPR